ncbi:MAG: pyridoxamine 5'-phosphate oxidase family protein [Arenicellales bacterium]|jgi:nitroimidazol reductase NimA-like FMN-containing flavoprotein (pyridoxamine 5'-phosphate oxidase superfamily)|nr:pyridoxamine 5'-phosphate oxidase family protein [Arenicellales bacterium]|tara:strand:+ start:718 stop:1125 length:408 start_codon:yes stop_codon:yes gene_type:complete
MNSKAHTLLLEAPSLIGFIGSADTDGMPRTVPVWYRWDGKVIHITTASSSVWVNNLINDSRSSFCVAEHGPPYQAVVMQGRVQVDNKDEAEVRRIFLRYMDAQQTEDYYAAIEYELRMVRFEPDRVMLRSSSRSR